MVAVGQPQFISVLANDTDPKRRFQVDGQIYEVDVTPMGQQQSIDYTEHINASIYDAAREQLLREYTFRQYTQQQRQTALEDIREMIRRNVNDAVYLWDPFLRANDLLHTLFHCYNTNARLRAIGSIAEIIKQVYQQKGKNADDIILEQKAVLNNATIQPAGLKLEFRMQHSGFGHSFHDRFLLFPGSSKRKPKVYSLGISINAIGNDHHIVQEVSHPQQVIDAFDELWVQLNRSECIVWRMP